jgi:hypothetical protein
VQIESTAIERDIAAIDLPAKETILSKNPKDVMERAEATFKKEERAREGAKAVRDYEAESRAVHEKTARLKALRLAKEAADQGPVGKKGSGKSKATPSA